MGAGLSYQLAHVNDASRLLAKGVGGGFGFRAAMNGSGAYHSCFRARWHIFRNMQSSHANHSYLPSYVWANVWCLACRLHSAPCVPTTFPYIHVHKNHPYGG